MDGETQAYPVHYRVEKPARFTRAQLLARILMLFVLGVIGVSLGTIFLVAYLGLPAVAAARLSSRGREAFFQTDAPRFVRVLRWYAAIFGWFGLVVEEPPTKETPENLRIEVETSGRPTPASALWRIVLGIPSAVVLAVVGIVAAFVWLWAAVEILVSERVGDVPYRILAGVQRWSVRLLGYQASLIEAYPPFDFEETSDRAVAAPPPTAGMISGPIHE
jgi:hypothetical protein